MENPVFNFYSATVISGDRENISVVAHEFAHNYSGNLVTNSSWEHFWLNEGWTVYTEREILRQIKGEKAAVFEAIVGWNELVYGIESYGGSESPETSLVLDLQGKRPDDVMSKISYEKGYTFLCFLEKLVGREKWIPFIPHVSPANPFPQPLRAKLTEFSILENSHEQHWTRTPSRLHSLSFTLMTLPQRRPSIPSTGTNGTTSLACPRSPTSTLQSTMNASALHRSGST